MEKFRGTHLGGSGWRRMVKARDCYDEEW